MAAMMRYPVDALWQEIAYLAYHLHWPLDELLDLEHMDRVRLVRAVAGLNERAWEAVRELARMDQSASRYLGGDLPVGHRFLFEVDGVEIGVFTAVRGLQVTVRRPTSSSRAARTASPTAARPDGLAEHRLLAAASPTPTRCSTG